MIAFPAVLIYSKQWLYCLLHVLNKYPAVIQYKQVSNILSSQWTINYLAVHPIAVSTIVTSILASVISVLISSTVVYCIMKRHYDTRTNVTTTGSRLKNEETVIYDLPNVAVDDKTIQHNEAYGVLWILIALF